jgi:hypothetical protein
MSLAGLLNPAGGLRYHLRAYRHSRTLWEPFRWALGEWLLGWQPSEPVLVVVGPSGGYNLQPFLFERFERVICLEPDPLARLIFARRLERAPLERRPRLEFVAEDTFVHHPERLVSWFASLDESCVLFSNIIGQLSALLGVSTLSAPELGRVRDAVHEVISTRAWASFHDRFSGTARPAFEGAVSCDSRLTNAEILEAAYATAPGADGDAPLDLLDHLSEGFFDPSLPHSYISWELEPGLFHLIEAVHSKTAPPG